MSHHFIAAASAVAASLLCAAPAFAQDFPNKSIKILVGFPAGGPSDVPARIIGAKLQTALGQPVVIENKTGAAGMIALNDMLGQARDGHTLLLCSYIDPTNTHLYKKVSYKLEDLAPVTMVSKAYYAFVVPTSSPANSMKEFIALAKASPGKYTFASPGNGSLGHVNIEHFMDLAGMQLLHVPYKGAGQAANDALAGVVHAMTDNLPSTLPHVKAGKLRALAVLAPERSPVLPDVPTYKELGFDAMGGTDVLGALARALASHAAAVV